MKKQLSNLFLLQLLGSLLGAHAIIGGNETQQGDWPFMAYVYDKPDPYSGYICGGSLINEQWVVTAAHCIGTVNPSFYGVILGEHTRSQPSCAEQVFDLTEIKRHNAFNSQQIFQNDIALLKLAEPAIFNHFVRPVNLVPEGFRTNKVLFPTFAGKSCSVLGWGETSNQNVSDTLLQLNKTILNEVVCAGLTYMSSSDYEQRVVNVGNKRFCAGGILGQDTCDGDSGGPLVCLHDDNHYYLHGITSYGAKICGQADKPGVYTKIADYRLWIDSMTK